MTATTTPSALTPFDSPESIQGHVDLDRLRADVRGCVLVPSDPGYAEMPPPFNVAGDFGPLAVVDVLDAGDVAAVIKYAAATGVEIAVRATGHGATPRADRPSTILIRTHCLDELSIEGHTARVGAGVRWRQLLDEAGALGLAAPAGSSPGVSIVGYLTGGGLSPVGRSLGYACDHVVAFEVVTGDGEVRRASVDENPGLFWGLRGGKGALGVVTAVELALVELPTIFGGCVFLDAETNADVLSAWSQWSAALPHEASTSLAIMRLPVMPGIPEPIAGRTSIAVRFAWTGHVEAGLEIIDTLVGDREVLLGAFGDMPFAELGAIHNDPSDPMPVATAGLMLQALPAEAVAVISEMAGANAECPQMVVELRRLGGLLERSTETSSALCHRDAGYLLHTIGLAVPPLVDAVTAHATSLRQALALWSDDGVLPNFGDWSTTGEVARQYDAETLARLGTLAATYDPRGVLADGNVVRAACADRETQ